MENGKSGIRLTLEPDQNTSADDIIIDAPTLGSVSTSPSGIPGEYAAGATGEDMLTSEERKMVEQFASEIDISDVDQVVKYGAAAQRNISGFSSSILRKVKTRDLGDIGSSLKELTIALDATLEPEKKGIFGIFQKAKRGVNSIIADYKKAEANVDKVEKDLQRHQVVLTQDISMFQQMYELNIEYYKELTMYIIAGKKALDKARSGKLRELEAKAAQTEDPQDVQNFRDFRDQCNRFDKKLHDLEITRIISIQSAPQVRLIQNNDRELLDKIQSSLANTIPLWRNQLVISLGIEHSKRAVQAQTELSDKTNELLAKNSETLKIAAQDIARESERPIVDMATLRQCNQDLITSLNEVVKIHEQGAQEREQAQDEFAKLENELKQALLEAGSR